LALRKAWGPIADAALAKQLGRKPTKDELLAEVQKRFGARAFRMARKGLEAAGSANKLTDEQLVVMAVLTAITKGREVFIFTRDADVLEQYYKLLCLMKEHYRAMLIADHYAARPEAFAFRKVPVPNDGVHVPGFVGSSILQLKTTDMGFNPLPAKFNFVMIYCFLLGDGPTEMRATFCGFCAETEMARMLKVKAATGGLSTDKFDGRNCTIHTSPFTLENHRVVVSIGKETTIPVGGSTTFGLDDFTNTLADNELTTHLSIDEPPAGDRR
jgi:hypothetical protein